MHGFDSPAPLLPEIFALHGKWRGSREALVCEDERQNWAEFSRSLIRFAQALRAAGVGPGDRVVVLMSNGVEMAHALFGTMTASSTSVPINLSVSDEALLGMIKDAGPRAIVCTEDQRARVDMLRDGLDAPLSVFLCCGHGADGWTTWDDFLRAGEGEAVSLDDTDPESLLNIIYSSGTTGVPKGIAHTQRGRRDWAYDLAISLRYHGASRTLLTIGLYSNISWVAMLCTLLAGGTLVIQRRFDADGFLDTVAAERITHTAMVPVQFQRVVERMVNREADVSSMQGMMSCGSPLHEGLKRQLFEQFSCGIIELYGLTEGIITTLDPEDAEGRWASVGRPLIGTDLRLIGNDDREAADGESGEIVSRGRITMPGYFKRPEASRDACWLDESGRTWLRSGDIGRFDSEGFLYIIDRKKDMILSGGQNVYPQDIEAVLIDHPGIDDVAVIGMPSANWGETPVALVVSGTNGKYSSAELRSWCNERVGKQQRIADVIKLEELPRNPNGKILKRELRKQFADRRYD